MLKHEIHKLNINNLFLYILKDLFILNQLNITSIRNGIMSRDKYGGKLVWSNYIDSLLQPI